MNVNKIIKIGLYISLIFISTFAFYGAFKLIDSESSDQKILTQSLIISLVMVFLKTDKIINFFRRN
jgi:hypothetical protein